MEWSIKKIRLDLKYVWKISRNASTFKENFIVEAKVDGFIGLGEVAPNIRYNETPESIQNSFEQFLKLSVQSIQNISELTETLNTCDLPNALRFGIESAYIHLHAQKENKSVFEFLGIQNPGKVATCYTLPMMELDEITPFFNEYNLARFSHIKIKVSDKEALAHLQVLSKLVQTPIMIDANEAWKDVDALLSFMHELKNIPVAFVEQPMPAAMKDEYIYLKQNSPLPLMADESVLDKPDFDLLQKQFHGINMKLMKAGGYLNGIRILNEAKKRNMQTMVGCMIETTLGISSAWNLCAGVNYADLDGCLIVENEPFHLLEELNGIFTQIV